LSPKISLKGAGIPTIDNIAFSRRQVVLGMAYTWLPKSGRRWIDRRICTGAKGQKERWSLPRFHQLKTTDASGYGAAPPEATPKTR